MQNPELREALLADWDSGIRPQRIIPGSVLSLVSEEVGRRDFEQYMCQTVRQIAEKEGKHAVDALLKIVVEDNLQNAFMGPHSNQPGGGPLQAELPCCISRWIP